MRRAVIVAVAVVAAAGGVGLTITGGGGGGESGTANLFVATSSCDTTPTRQASPTTFANAAASAIACSFDQAYQAANLGDTVLVRPGTYGDQTILSHAPKESAGDAADVTFAPDTGASVTVGILALGTTGVPSAGPDHVTVRDMALRSAAPAWEPTNVEAAARVWVGSNDITLLRLDGGSFNMHGVKNVSLLDGDWGPCLAGANTTTGAQNSGPCANSKIDAYGYTFGNQNDGILIEGNTFHDMKFGQSCFHTSEGGTNSQITVDCHWECLFLNSSDNVTVRDNVFRDCGIMGIYFTSEGVAAQGFADVLFENNSFGAAVRYGDPRHYANEAYNGAQGLAFGACTTNAVREAYTNVDVRFNSFGGGAGITDESGAGCATAGTGVRIYGNLGAKQGCLTDPAVTYAYNVWTGSNAGTCAATDTNTGHTTPRPFFASDTHGATMDLHLSGATAAPDDYVPTGTLGGCPTVDLDGDSRPAATNCDAGADERG